MSEPTINLESAEKDTFPENGIYPEGQVPQDAKKEKQHVTLKELIDFVRDVAIILAIVLFVRSYFVSPFQINGNSMETSYHSNEYILVNKFSYAMIGDWRVGDPER